MIVEKAERVARDEVVLSKNEIESVDQWWAPFCCGVEIEIEIDRYRYGMRINQCLSWIERPLSIEFKSTKQFTNTTKYLPHKFNHSINSFNC